MTNVVVSVDMVHQMVAIINQNHQTTISRDSILIANLQNLLIEQGLIERTNLYACSVITR